MRFKLLTSAVGVTVVSGCAVLYSYGDYEDGAGGQGGDTPPTACNVDNDCTVKDQECATAICKNGKCEIRAAEKDTRTKAQQPGDCKTRVCNGRGRTTEIPDDGDVQADSNDCTQDVCDDGDPAHPLEEPGTACGNSDRTRCDSAGECVGCSDDADCPQSTACAESHCRERTCTSERRPVGTPCAASECQGDFTWATSGCDAVGSCVTQTEECGQFRCGPEGCLTTCSDSSQCLTGFHCDEGVCRDCVTCSQWLSGLVASSTAPFCTPSTALHQSVIDCACSLGSPCVENLACNEAICLGAAPVPESCRSCLERCEEANACSMDL